MAYVTPKSGWGSKPSVKGKTRHESHSFAQFKDDIADLKKALKTKSKSRGHKNVATTAATVLILNRKLG